MEKLTGMTQIERFDSYIDAALESVGGFDPIKIKSLADAAKKEIAFLDPLGDAEASDPGKSVPEGLYETAKAVRLAGEYPYFIAKVIAVWLFAQRGKISEVIAKGGVKQAARDFLGIRFEYELLQMVEESFETLPDLQLGNEAKTELMRKAYRQGYHYEKVYRGCAQCHMAAVSDVTGREDPVMFRAANGLAAGIGLLGDGVCGGYSGGILSMGLFAGRRREFFDGDKAEKDLCTRLAKKLHDKYIATYGSVICHDIHRDIFGRAFHITKPEEKEAFELAGAHKQDKCPAVVGTSAAWVAEILYDEGFLLDSAEEK